MSLQDDDKLDTHHIRVTQLADPNAGPSGFWWNVRLYGIYLPIFSALPLLIATMVAFRPIAYLLPAAEDNFLDAGARLTLLPNLVLAGAMLPLVMLVTRFLLWGLLSMEAQKARSGSLPGADQLLDVKPKLFKAALLLVVALYPAVYALSRPYVSVGPVGLVVNDGKEYISRRHPWEDLRTIATSCKPEQSAPGGYKATYVMGFSGGDKVDVMTADMQDFIKAWQQFFQALKKYQYDFSSDIDPGCPVKWVSVLRDPPPLRRLGK